MFSERSDGIVCLRVLGPLVLATVTLVAVSLQSLRRSSTGFPAVEPGLASAVKRGVAELPSVFNTGRPQDVPGNRADLVAAFST